MESELLKIGKLYELKILKAGGEFSKMPEGFCTMMWEGKSSIEPAIRVANYDFNSGPFLVVDIDNNEGRIEYQILTPEEKIGWAYFGSYTKTPYYFIELIERKEPEENG